MNKRYIVPIIAVITFAVGSVAMVLPFLPLGWFLYIVTALILLPYFRGIEKIFRKLAENDRSNITHKAVDRVARLYRWVGDKEHAEELEELSGKSSSDEARGS